MNKRLTDSELLEILQKKQEIQEEAPKHTLSLFISTFGLEEGTLKIPVKLIYRLYKLWAKHPLGEGPFYIEMSLLMPNKRIIEGRECYLLNKTTLKINEELYKLIKKKERNPQKSHYFRKHFDAFLKYAKIEAGSDWILVSRVRSIYLAWVKNKYKKNPLGQQNFNGFCKLYFKTRGEPLEIAINKKALNAEEENHQKKT